MLKIRRALSALVLVAVCVQPARAVEAPKTGAGTVHMPISCPADVAADFDRGLALLHNFWYDRALIVFDGVIAKEPQCRIAYWGAAMTYNHPLWSPPTKTDLTAALKVVQRGRSARIANERERGLFDAVSALYGDGDVTPATIVARNGAYHAAMERLVTRYPDDEVQLFTALAILGDGSPSLAARERAASIAQAVHTHQPNHPGALHYLIHAYDTDGMYERGLPAARAYAASAPAVPHALHMPSHIFNALGYWQDSADSNLAAWNASVAAVVTNHEDPNMRDFHTLQFGQYALLQLGRYAEARKQAVDALDQYDANLARIAREHLTSGDAYQELRSLDFPAVGMTANYVLSSGDFTLVSRLPVDPSTPLVDAMARNIRTFAAAATHDEAALARANEHAQALLASVAADDKRSKYPILALAQEDLAIIARAHGDAAGASRALDAALTLERDAPKHWQPTYLGVPAHELAGRWALEDGRYTAAADNFRTAIGLFPRRSKAIYGLAVAMGRSGNSADAHKFAQAFLAMWEHADPGIPELAVAKNL